MFAILETGGKQYKVEEGDVIEVELIDKNYISAQNKVSFNDILLIKDTELHLGQPYVKNGTIQAQVIEEFKAPKITVFKKKSKKGYRKTRGHRQLLHRIKIEKIQITRSVEKKGEAEAQTDLKVTKSGMAKKTPTSAKSSVGKTTVEKKAKISTKTKKTPTKGKENK